MEQYKYLGCCHRLLFDTKTDFCVFEPLHKKMDTFGYSGKEPANAGKWIGYFERILILTFILTGTTEGIGFLLAAKSIFRFGELSKAQEIKTTEYVLIGTLASFTIAIIIGLTVLQIIK